MHTAVRRGFATAILSAALLGGCSFEQYKAPIATFAQATKDSTATVNALNETTATRARERRKAEALAAPAGALRPLTDTECAPAAERCRLGLLKSAQGPAEEVFPEPPLEIVLEALAAMEQYAGRLKAITEDETRAAVAADFTAAAGSVVNIDAAAKAANAAALKKEGKPPPAPSTSPRIDQLAPPVAAGLSWLVGTYIDHVRFEALREATKNADPVVQEAKKALDAMATVGAWDLRSDLTERVRSRRDAYRDSAPTARSASYDAYLESARAYDAVLAAAPEKAFGRLAQSHAALTKALNDPDVNVAQQIATIDRLAAEAAALAKIVEDIRKALEKPQ